MPVPTVAKLIRSHVVAYRGAVAVYLQSPNTHEPGSSGTSSSLVHSAQYPFDKLRLSQGMSANDTAISPDPLHDDVSCCDSNPL